ncbi:MAG TPA: GNAT family N-acetyltransferase [Candidatus Eremiobacteraceae bacterium]|nr:GNAT family N-acetyltransferase [Candidatus Eremiobacteraceae bacterium]
MTTARSRDLKTPRLLLRPFSMDDLDAHAEILRDPLVTRYLPRGPFAPEEARAISTRVLDHFIGHWERHEFGVWGVVEATTGLLIGQCGLNYLPDNPEVEVLYLLARAAWGRGLATEAACASVQYGFEVVGLNRIVGITMPENVASQRVLTKAGLRYEKDAMFYGIHAKYFALNRPSS